MMNGGNTMSYMTIMSFLIVTSRFSDHSLGGAEGLPYRKGDRSFEIFGVIRPEVIRKKLPHAERFFRVLEEKL